MRRFFFSVFWLLFAAVLLSFAAGAGKYRPLLLACGAGSLLMAAYLFWYHLVHIPRWKKTSREVGLNLLVLVPVHPFLARAVLLLSGAGLRPKKIRRAFELHIAAARKYGLAEFARLLASDLSLVAGSLEPGTLILWETRAPIPSAFRGYIRRKQEVREAVWEKGGWGLVRRFAGRSARRGALVWTGRDRFGRCAFEQENGDNHFFSSRSAVHGISHHGGQRQVQTGE
ncbi:MAG: hypothetical protein IMW96_10975 [Thermoanaerobacteraceae bacterium]|nr:hypothetical protein [Thermoanaerobacteraceae bacterium]